MQGMSLQLGELHGIAYYTMEDAGYSVVATLAGQDGRPVRFESTLLPGQKVVVSIPGHRGSQGQTVEFARQGHPHAGGDNLSWWPIRPMTTRTSRPAGRTGAAAFDRFASRPKRHRQKELQ